MYLSDDEVKQDDLMWSIKSDDRAMSELKWCGRNVLHRKQVTNKDLRFYAYLMRRAVEIIEKEREQ